MTVIRRFSSTESLLSVKGAIVLRIDLMFSFKS